MDIGVGDVVLITRFAGAPITLGDRELYVLRESEILAKVEA